ncbi:hypothetical protein I4U23_030887 [Adineta vaga]|nr:hypothetical protein I4U23_030887 [Adineta vaga]
MDITGVKLIISCIFFFTTFLCLTIPICLYSCLKLHKKSSTTRSHCTLFSVNTLINCITCFGGGIFLGACLLDLLPEVISHMNMTLKMEFQYDNESLKHYPIAEILIAGGFFLVLFLEQMILSFRLNSTHSIAQIEKRQPIIIAHDDDDETSFINDKDPLMTRTSSTEHRFEISEHKDDLRSHQNRVVYTRNFILILSLIIHSIFEGIALGSIKELKSFFELFFAIIIHKSIITFSVGLKLMNLSNKRLVYCACFILSIATPIGMLIVLSMQEFLPNNRTAKMTHEILRAFACGTFFYITFMDVLPHELNLNSHQRQSTTSQHRFLKTFCIFIGFSFIALLSFLMK